MKVISTIEQMLFSTVMIEAAQKDNWAAGTGYVFQYEYKGGPAYFLVTNRHVVEQCDLGKFMFFCGDGNGQPILGKAHQFNFDEFAKWWFFHPDPQIDIAVMALVPAFNQITQKNIKIYFRCLSESIIPNEQQISEIDAIEDVLFIGYPNGIFDTHNLLPVARKGITATPIAIDYENRPHFLIDASVFPGSSGSPVFLYTKGGWNQKESGALKLENRLFFLGMISSGYFQEEEGKIEFIEVPTDLRPVYKTNQMINLGIVIKSSKVIETIKLYITHLEENESNK
ncbi:serine protease [Gemmatimonadota bacterium]